MRGSAFRTPAPAARTRHAKPERAVERVCDRALAIAGWWVIRWKNTAVPIRGTNRWMFQGTKGVPDRLAVKERGAGVGEVVALEYKAAGGTQSPEQIEFQRRWEAAGRRYVLARGPEDLEVVKHQQGVKILRALIEHVQSPIHELNAVIDATPLFLPKDYQMGLWDPETGEALLVAKDDPRLKKAKKPAVPAKGKKAKRGKAKAAKGE